MEKHTVIRNGLIFIGVGIIIGLLLSASLNLTKNSDATSTQVTIDNPVEPQVEGDNAGIGILNELSNAFANVAEKVNPSVVTICTETTIKARGMQGSPFGDFFGDEFFKRFFQSPQVPGREYKQHGLGSGVIASSDGIIITNNHVVRNADDIKVRLMDGTEYKAEIKGTDERSDLAIIKIKAKDLPAIKFGDSEKVRVGEWVLAIGSPLSPELAHTVTSGIISAKGRTGIGLSSYQDYIQTDAAINPGNSGGALVNLKGKLVGINSAIATRNGGFMGIGFAIPSSLAKKVMTDILEKGRVVRGWLGVYIQNVDEELAKAMGMEKPVGVVISNVQEDSPAEKAGIKAGDVVIKYNDRKLKNTIELSAWVANEKIGSTIQLTLLRDNKEKIIKVKLGERPEEPEKIAAKSKMSENIGINVANLTSDIIRKYELKMKKEGVVITSVNRGSVAARSGLRQGDVILKINHKPVINVSDYDKLMKKVKPGDTLLFYIQREEARLFVAFTVPEE